MRQDYNVEHVQTNIERHFVDARWTGPLAITICFAVAKLLIHFLTNGQYGYFRDELYFIACGDHLDWGYVDHAPLVALVARVSRTVLGDSLFAVRFFPAVAGALKVLLTGLIAREFGGGRLACFLACLCVFVAPAYLTIDALLTMNSFEIMFWTGCAYFAVRAIKRDSSRDWLWFGVLAGLGLQNKHSMLFFGFGIFLGLLLTPARRFFKDKWLWIGGSLAILIFLPNIIWEFRHDWATLELLRNVKSSGKNVDLSPVRFIGEQLLMLNPLTAPVWLAGLYFLFFDADGKRYKLLGITYVSVLALMIALKGKSYYLLPAYPMLFAGGATLWEKLLAKRRYVAWLKVAYPLLLLAGGAALAPLSLPILPVDSLMRYQQAIGIEPPKTEVGHDGALPQYFGDMFGWPEMVETVARTYHKLPPAERVTAAIYTGNYGEAAAIDFFGPRYGLPKAISAHQSYYLWGPRDYTGEVMILLQSDREDAEKHCDSVEESTTLNHPFSMAEEHYTIFICRGLKQPLRELWPRLKHWN